MKQTINLLPLKAKKIRNWLSFNNLLVVLALSFFSGLSLTAFWGWQGHQLQAEVDEQQQLLVSCSQQLIELSAQLDRPKVFSEVSLQLEQQQNQLQAMQKMLEISSALSVAKSQGFLLAIGSLQDSLPFRATFESFKISRGQRLDYVNGTSANAHDMPELLGNLRAAGLLKDQIISVSVLNNGAEHQFKILSSQQETE